MRPLRSCNLVTSFMIWSHTPERNDQYKLIHYHASKILQGKFWNYRKLKAVCVLWQRLGMGKKKSQLQLLLWICQFYSHERDLKAVDSCSFHSFRWTGVSPGAERLRRSAPLSRAMRLWGQTIELSTSGMTTNLRMHKPNLTMQGLQIANKALGRAEPF